MPVNPGSDLVPLARIVDNSRSCRLVWKVQQRLIVSPSWSEEQCRSWIAEHFGLEDEAAQWCLEQAMARLRSWPPYPSTRRRRLVGPPDEPNPVWDNVVRLLEENIARE